MDKAIAFKYYVGFKFSSLEFEDQAAVRKGIRLGYLIIERSSGIVRFA